MKLNKLLKYLPLLAPLPEAYAVGLAIQRELKWHIAVVVVASLIVAGTGFWGVGIANRMAEFNAGLKAGDRKDFTAPTWRAMLVLAVWFTGVTLLTVFLDVYPVLQKWTPLGLVVIGFSAAYLYSLSNIQEAREQEFTAHRQKIEKEKENSRNQRKAERKEEKERAQETAVIEQKIRARTKGKRAGGKNKVGDAELLILWREDPFLTNTQMADLLVERGYADKFTRQAVGSRRNAMEVKGLIVTNTDGRVVQYIDSDASGIPEYAGVSGAGESGTVQNGDGK